MAGKVRNEVEGQAKVSGEESLESFYSSIVGILSAMQVSEPYAQLFATALTTASSNANPGAIEKYTAALKKFNSTIAKTADLMKKGKLKPGSAGFDEDSLMAYVQGVVPMGNKDVASGLRRFSGAKKEISTLNQYKSSDDEGIKGFRQNMTKAKSELGSAAKSLSASVKSALGGASGSYTERSLNRLNGLLANLEKILAPFPDEAKTPESPVKRLVRKRKNTAVEAEKPVKKAASARKIRVKKAAKEAPAEETVQDEKPSAKKRITVDTRAKSGEGLLKKAEKAKSSAKNIRQLADIEADIYKELSDSKNVSVSTNFKALLDKKTNGAGNDEISTYAAMLSKSVNQGVSVSPKKVDRIHSLINEWNVANRYNELRKGAYMPSMAVSGLNSVMPELKFLASPYGTDKMAVSGSKIPALEKQIGRINNDDKLNPETKLEKIREAIDSAFTMQTKGTADLMEIAESAQKQAEKNTQEIEKIKAQKPAGKAPAEAAVQQTKESGELIRNESGGREMEDFRGRWEKIVRENTAGSYDAQTVAQALENANINVTNGYFDIEKLANAIGTGKKEQGLIQQASTEDVVKYIAANTIRTHDAVFGQRALTMTDKGKFILGDTDDIIAWINNPKTVTEFIEYALAQRKGKSSRSLVSAEQISDELKKAKEASSYKGASLGQIDRKAIEIELKTNGESYDNSKINSIARQRSFAMNTLMEVLTSKDIASNDVKKSIIASALNDKGDFDYDRIDIMRSMLRAAQIDSKNARAQDKSSAGKKLADMSWTLTNRRMLENGFSDDQISKVNAFKGKEQGLRLGNALYKLYLDEINEAKKKIKSDADSKVENLSYKRMEENMDRYGFSAAQRQQVLQHKGEYRGRTLSNLEYSSILDGMKADNAENLKRQRDALSKNKLDVQSQNLLRDIASAEISEALKDSLRTELNDFLGGKRTDTDLSVIRGRLTGYKKGSYTDEQQIRDIKRDSRNERDLNRLAGKAVDSKFVTQGQIDSLRKQYASDRDPASVKFWESFRTKLDSYLEAQRQGRRSEAESKSSMKEAVKASNLSIDADTLKLQIERSGLANDKKRALNQDLSDVLNGNALDMDLSTVRKRFANFVEADRKNPKEKTEAKEITEAEQRFRRERSRERIYDKAVNLGIMSSDDRNAYKDLFKGDNSLAITEELNNLAKQIADIEKANTERRKTEAQFLQGNKLQDLIRSAEKKGLSEFSDSEGNARKISDARAEDINYLKRAIQIKPQQEIESLAGGMGTKFLEDSIRKHIESYVQRISNIVPAFIGRSDDVKRLAGLSSDRLNSLARQQTLSMYKPFRNRISEIASSDVSDKAILSRLQKIGQDGGIEHEFKQVFEDLDKNTLEILKNLDEQEKRDQARKEGRDYDKEQQAKRDAERDRLTGSDSWQTELYKNNPEYKANMDAIAVMNTQISELQARRAATTNADDIKALDKSIRSLDKSSNTLRQRNDQLRREAEKLADEQKRTRMSFGKSITQSIKAGLYRWNQNSQSRGGIAGAFAKFGANRMEGGALQKVLGVNVGGILGLAAAEGGRKIAQAVSRGIKESLADFGNVQTIQTNLGTVYGSQSAADMRFADIAKYATKSPFGVQQTSDFAVLLKQSGVYENDLMKTLSMIGDVAGGNQEKYSRIANNYAQIVAANKATAMDLRQFANAGIPIYKAIKDYLASQDKEKYGGLDTAAVRKMTQNGEITSDVIEGVFRMLTSEGGAFNNSVQRGAKTYKAQMQNMQDIRQLAGAAVGERIFSFGRDWNFNNSYSLDKEAKSIFQGILDFTEKIYTVIDKEASKTNLEAKWKVSENDKQRKKDLQEAINMLKNNPELDATGAGAEFFENALKKFTPTYDYADQRAVASQLYDVFEDKASKYAENSTEDARSLVETRKKLAQDLFILYRQQDELEDHGKTWTNEYKELKDEIHQLSGMIHSLDPKYTEIMSLSFTLSGALKKNAKRAEKNYEEARRYSYFKNQTLAESAMSMAYGTAAKAEGNNKNSSANLSAWIAEQYKGTSAYKAEQEKLTKENMRKAEDADKWLKDNNVTASNRFGFVSSVKSMSQLADNLNDYFTTEEGRITREYITNEDNSLTKEGLIVMKNQNELIHAILSNSDIASPLRGVQLQKMGAGGTEYNTTLTTILGEILRFAKNPEFGSRDDPSVAEKNYYANIAALYKLFDSLESKTEPLTKDEENMRTILSKALSPQTLVTVDTDKLKAIEAAQSKEYIPLWKRIANQSLGVPIQMLTNNRSNVGALYDKVRTRSQTGQIATAMLQSGSSFDRVADMMSYTGAMSSKINGGATSTGQVDWQKTAMNIRDFALSLSSATEVTTAYVSSLSEQQSQVYSILTGWKSMEDFDKLTDEKLKDNLGQIQQWSKNTVTAYQSTFGYSGAAEDLDKNVIDTLYEIKKSNGDKRRTYLDKLTQQMSVLSEMLKTQRQTAETVLAIKNSMKDLRQQTESNEDEIFLNTVSTVGSGIPEFKGMRPEAEMALWKSLLSSMNSQQTLVQAYDTDKSGKLSYNELKTQLPDILEELRIIGKSTEGVSKGIGKIAMKPVEKVSLPSTESKVETESLERLSKDEQARGLIDAIKSGTGKDTLNSLYRQTSFNAVEWGKYAKDNGLSIDQAMSVTRSSSGDIPFIQKGFNTASGKMRLAAESVTVQAKEIGVQGAAENALEQLSSSANNFAESIDNLANSNIYAELSKDEKAREVIDAIKGGAEEDTIQSLYTQTGLNGLDWGMYAKDNGLSLEQAKKVRTGSLGVIERGFINANGKMKLSAKKAVNQPVSLANNFADSTDNLAYSNMYMEAYKKLGKPDTEYKNANNIETDLSSDRKQSAIHAFDAPFVMSIMNSLFGGKDGTRFLPYTDFSGNIMTQIGSNTRNQQRALDFLDSFGFSGAGSKSMSNFVNSSINYWGTGANFNAEDFKKDAVSLGAAANYAGISDAGNRLEGIGTLLSSGDESSIAKAKEDYEALIEEMSKGDMERALGDQLKNISQSMKETFSSSLFNGINDSFAQIGKNLKDGEDATDGMYKIWKNVGREITGTIGATLTTTGLNIASSAAIDKNWGLVAAGLAMAASGGICSIASGLMSDSSDLSDDSKDDGREQRIQNLKDALSDLIDQAKTDAEYYDKNLLHKNALSANEAVSVRSVNDAIITPNGNIVTTHPDDYLIATKTPDSLIGGGGQANVTVQVNPVVINNSSANITAQTETRENDDGSVDIVTTIVDVMNMALATGKADEGMAAYEANKNGRSVVY